MSFFLGFDFRDLEIFVAVVEEGSITGAARRLGVSQPSVSQLLAGLETSLRTELIDRSERPLQTTAAGRHFYDRATALLKDAERVSQGLRKADYSLLRHVKLAVTDSIITAVGEGIVEVVKQRTQNWSLSAGQSHLHARALLSRQVDMIITDDPMDEHSGLQRFTLLREPFVIAVPASYRNAENPAAILEQLALIRYSAASMIGRQVERYLRREQLQPPARIQLDNSFAVSSLVASGVGCAITTPLCLFKACLSPTDSGHRQIRLLPVAGFDRELILVCRERELGNLPDAVAKDCRKLLRQTFQQVVKQHYPDLLYRIDIS